MEQASLLGKLALFRENMNNIEIKNLYKSFGEQKVLNDISLDIQSGELFTLLGPSGCGKSTLLRILAGFETADSGEIRIDNQNILPIPSEKRKIGMVFQNYSLFSNMTVFGNVAYALKIRKIPRAEIEKEVASVLELVNLSGYQNRKIDELSGGEQQRIAIARALMAKPQVLLLDEPLSNLDARLRESLRKQIREIQQRLGITVIFVTHDQHEAMAISDKIAVLNKGKVEQCDVPKQIYAQPKTRFVAEFVGDSNIFSKENLQKLKMDIPSNAGYYLIRPENLKVFREKDSSSLVGKIIDIEFSGAFSRIYIQSDFGILQAMELFTTGEKWEKGEEIGFSILENHLIALED